MRSSFADADGCQPESGRLAGGILSLLLLLVVIGATLYYTFGQVVPPGYFGVRQVTAGPGQGFSNRGLPPGLHFTVPFLVGVHLVPETVQVLSFHRSGTEEGEQAGDQDPDRVSGLEIRTSDGLSVDLDVSVLTRFYDSPSNSGVSSSEDSHGGPAELFTRVGLSEKDWDNQIRRVAADELRQALGALLARQFYEGPSDRAAALVRAQREMRKRLNPMGISVESVLLRRYTYQDDRFDEAIFNKNLQEQEQRLKDASGKLAEVKAKLEQVEAEWDARVATLRIQGENNAQVIKSEATLYESRKRADGDLLVAKATAEVDRLRAGALAQSAAADVYIAREMAPLLSSLKGGVVANLDPYDVDSWAKRLGVGAGVGVSAEGKPRARPSVAGLAAGVTSEKSLPAPSAGSGTTGQAGGAPISQGEK